MRVNVVFALCLLLCCGMAHAHDDFGIVVGGVAVTVGNATNIADGSSANLSGRISYDPSTNTLTLQDAYIEIIDLAEDQSIIDYGIEIARDSLHIEVVGRNTVFGPLVGIAGRHISFGGQGFIDIEGQSRGLEAHSVAVSGGCSVMCGALAYSISTRDLLVENSTLRIINAIGMAALHEFADLNRVELSGCAVTEPASGVAYNPDLHTLTGDGPIDSDVVISPVSTAVLDVPAGIPIRQQRGYYSIGGQRIGPPSQSGIYIIGNKVVIFQ